MTNFVGDLGVTSTVADTIGLELYGAWDTVTTVINGTTYVYVAGAADDGIQIFTLSSSGVLTAAGQYIDSSATELNNPRAMDIVEVGNNRFLVVAAGDDDAVSTFRISTSGASRGQLTLAHTVINGSGHYLDYANGVDTFETSQGSFIAISAYYSDAVSVFRVSNNGTMTQIDVETDADSAGRRLNGTDDITIHSIGSRTFLYAVGDADSGVSVFEIAGNGRLTYVTSVGVAAYSGRMEGIAAGRFDGRDFLIVPDHSDGELHVFSLAANGTPTFVSTYEVYDRNGGYRNYDVDVVDIDGQPFVISHTESNDTIAIYSLDRSGTLTLIQQLRDVAALEDVSQVNYTSVGGRHFILATSYNGDRITAVEIGGGDDVISGSTGNDNILGMIGDDTLVGRAGNDDIFGGAGDDLLSGQSGNDKLFGGAGIDILVGGGGNDVLEGGADADYLIGGAGLDTASFAGSNAGVTVDLAAGTATGGHATGDHLNSIENLIGSGFADTLTGTGGNNTIRGGRGNDTIYGGNGIDRIFGDGGRDFIRGGGSRDIINGGGGNDTLLGESGNDTLNGAGGNDRVSGGEGNDRINGGNGNDIIDGGVGNDDLTSGSGRDVFVFDDNFGSDMVRDFAVNIDTIDFSLHSGFNSFADVRAAMFEFGGNTIIGSGTHSIQLLGVTNAQLDSGDFEF